MVSFCVTYLFVYASHLCRHSPFTNTFEDNDLVGTIPMSFLNKISERQPIEVDLSSNNLSGSLPLQLDR